VVLENVDLHISPDLAIVLASIGLVVSEGTAEGPIVGLYRKCWIDELVWVFLSVWNYKMFIYVVIFLYKLLHYSIIFDEGNWVLLLNNGMRLVYEYRCIYSIICMYLQLYAVGYGHINTVQSVFVADQFTEEVSFHLNVLV